jgi:uncharacterized protein YwgA
MTKPEETVAAVLNAANGTLIGRVRLQKIFYLLDQLGLRSGFDYEYYHYGPYSADLSTAVADARAFHKIDEETGSRVSDGVIYSIYKLRPDTEISSGAYGKLGEKRAKQLVGLLKDEDATVLELAATIHWLKHKEKITKWDEELRRRKGAKVQSGRANKAKKLLVDIHLL